MAGQIVRKSPHVSIQSRRKALAWVRCMRELMAEHIRSESKVSTAASPAPTNTSYTSASAPSASDGFDDFENF